MHDNDGSERTVAESPAEAADSGFGVELARGILQFRSDQELEEDIVASYKLVLVYPDIGKLQQDKPRWVQTLFVVLQRYAPLLAADPVVAASFIMSYARRDYLGIDVIRQLSKTQHQLEQTILHHKIYRQNANFYREG